MAENLELHMEALDLTDENSRRERDAYQGLAREYRQIASQLETTATQMAGYQDLPMGRHDPKAMASPRIRAAFERFVSLEQELLALLQKRVELDRRMLITMGGQMQAGMHACRDRSTQVPAGVPTADRLDPASSRS